VIGPEESESSDYHWQQLVAGPEGPTEIDADLVPLMADVWSRGFETTNSCQGRPGRYPAFVMFADPPHAAAFASMYWGHDQSS
jgi:hypothetical protein